MPESQDPASWVAVALANPEPEFVRLPQFHLLLPFRLEYKHTTPSAPKAWQDPADIAEVVSGAGTIKELVFWR
jgi:hypothetical protein